MLSVKPLLQNVSEINLISLSNSDFEHIIIDGCVRIIIKVTFHLWTKRIATDINPVNVGLRYMEVVLNTSKSRKSKIELFSLF